MASAAALAFAGKSVTTPVIAFIVKKAFDYLSKHCKAEGMEEVRNRLLSALPTIQAVFDVVNPDRIKDQSSALDAWLWKLRDAVEEAEDAIDELEYYELEEKAKDHKVSDWGSSFAKMKHNAVKSVKRIRVLDKTVKHFTHRGTLKRLRKAVEGLDKAFAGVEVFLALTDRLNGSTSNNQQQKLLMDRNRETASTLTATEVFGRDEEKEQLVGWLTKIPDEQAEIASTNHVSIISIVGHGGMGKTTLAQLVCKDERVLKNFDTVIWVYVSTSFDAATVTRKILESAAWERLCASNYLEPLQQALRKSIQSKKYLLILDDVWEDKAIDQWEKLFAPLRAANTGSMVLLTTRMLSVAEMAANVMRSERRYLPLSGLEEKANLRLFTHHAFVGLKPEDYAYLRPTSEEIVKKLNGCPLVTKVVGGHLRANMRSEFWSTFLQESLKHFECRAEDIMKVIKLSYYHLPAELQTCFRYCSIFPRDYILLERELISMWVGSGLIPQPTNEERRPEDIGEDYLAQLTSKSFVDVKSEYNPFTEKHEDTIVIHDLMHDLATCVSSGECAIMASNSKKVPRTVRHLWVEDNNNLLAEEVKEISHLQNLRTIVISGVYKNFTDAFEEVIESLKALRLMVTGVMGLSTDRIAKSKHLRYLKIGKNSQQTMHGVSKLYHLIMLYCHYYDVRSETKQLRDFENLACLRHIDYGQYGFGEFPIARLTSLQELRNFEVQKKKGYQICALRDLRSLRVLEVNGLQNVENHEEGRNAKLNEKQYLSSLSLNWTGSSGAGSTNDSIIDHLEPHANLKELQIRGYYGINLPVWIMNLSINNMVSLELKDCIRWEHLPSLGKLQFLEHLKLENLPELKGIGQSLDVSSNDGIYTFLPPCLDTLIVERCKQLRELPGLPYSLVKLEVRDVGLQILPRIYEQSSNSNGTKQTSKSSKLRSIIITDCPDLVSLERGLLVQKEYMQALRSLCIMNCEQLQHMPPLFEEMDQLVDFRIERCPKLTMTTNGEEMVLPFSLENLSIKKCGCMERALLGSLQGLTNLVSLDLMVCSHVTSLPSPEVFESLKALRWMDIAWSPCIIPLWIGNHVLRQARRGDIIHPSTSGGAALFLFSAHRIPQD